MRFPYDSKLRPTLPVLLSGLTTSLEARALVDSGADVNVLPWSMGLRLGFTWNPNKATIRIVGAPERAAAMPVLLSMTVGDLPSATQAFAWSQSDDVPLLLGQTNFFMEFDVCFFRSQMAFSVVRKHQA